MITSAFNLIANKTISRFLFLILMIVGVTGHSQELPAKPSAGHTFMLGSKFTLKLLPAGSSKFDVSIVNHEPFRETVNLLDNDHLFEEEGEKGTIDFYFCLGTFGDTDAEREKNTHVLLLMKNWSKWSVSYVSEIQTTEGGPFEPTSNMGAGSGIIGTEMWPYMIYQISLHSFQKQR